jgi:hypothetical protein
MQQINPSNGGVLLEISQAPGHCDLAADAPRVGYVVRVGGGVPWLKPRQAVVYDPRQATLFYTSQALCRQSDIIAVLEGVFRATCPNGCHEQPGAGCSSCPSEEATGSIK